MILFIKILRKNTFRDIIYTEKNNLKNKHLGNCYKKNVGNKNSMSTRVRVKDTYREREGELLFVIEREIKSDNQCGCATL